MKSEKRKSNLSPLSPEQLPRVEYVTGEHVHDELSNRGFEPVDVAIWVVSYNHPDGSSVDIYTGGRWRYISQEGREQEGRNFDDLTKILDSK